MVMQGLGYRRSRFCDPADVSTVLNNLQSSSCIFVSVMVLSSLLHVHDADLQRRWSRAVTLSQIEPRAGDL